MARTHRVVDVVSGTITDVPYTPQEEADADAAKAADDAAQAPVIADQQRRDGIAANADYLDLFTRVKTATGPQIDQWLTTNVTTLTQARTVLGAIIKLLAVRG